MYETFTKTFRRAVARSSGICIAEGATEIDARHLLAAILRERRSNLTTLVEVLARRGFTGLKPACDSFAGEYPEPGRIARLPLTSGYKDLVLASIETARELRHKHIGTEHAFVTAFAMEIPPALQIARLAGTSASEIAESGRQIAAEGKTRIEE